jgi:hypothetical protein
MTPLPDFASAETAIRSALAHHAETDPDVGAVKVELEEVLALLSSPGRETRSPVGAPSRAADLFERSKHTTARKAQRLCYAVKVLAELAQQQGGREPAPGMITRDVTPARKLPAAQAEVPHEEGMNARAMTPDTESMLRDIAENLEDVNACNPGQ